MSDHNRRNILQHVGTVAIGLSAGFEILPVGAAKADPDGNGPETPDLVIANNSADTREIRLSITPPGNHEKTLYSQKFELPGLNEPHLSDRSKAQFRGTITASGKTNLYRVSAKLPKGSSDQIQMQITPDGLPDPSTISVSVEPGGDITTLGSWR